MNECDSKFMLPSVVAWQVAVLFFVTFLHRLLNVYSIVWHLISLH